MALHFVSALTLLLFTLGLAGQARGDEEADPNAPRSGWNAPGWSADAEVDPIAYAAGGYSLHVGFGRGRVRADLGAFAADIPEWLHQSEGFDVRMDGFGAKLDVFLREGWSGPFAGLEAGLLGMTLRSPDGDHDFDRRLQVGGRVGWRVPLAAGFYATPWLGIDYAFGAGDRDVGAYRYEESPWVFFPTVHVGYQFGG
jgi:hypothetical protein